MRDIEGFLLYKSYWNAMYDLDNDSKAKIITAICKYVWDEKEPDLTGELRRLFAAIKPNIDNNINAIMNGKKGGRPKKTASEKRGVFENQKGGFLKFKNQKEKEKEKEYKKENTICSPAANNESEIDKVFNLLWKIYPVKRVKSQVSKKSKKAIYEIGIVEMQRAIHRYLSDLEQDDWRKPQNGSTFFNGGYIDYLDENYEKPVVKQNSKKSRFNNFPQRQWDFDEMQRLEDERRDKQRKEVH